MDKHTKQLKAVLDDLLRERDPRAMRADDPVEIVWDYDRAPDQEVVALVASCLAYGKVELLKAAIVEALEPLGRRPAEALREVAAGGEEAIAELADALEGFVYRMTRGEDVVDLFVGIGRVLNEFGSLEAAYAASEGETHLERASGLVQALRARRHRETFERGLRYLLPDPADGSACKRLHLFFRWVVRGPDGVDLGLWDAADPSEILMPLDTHTSRLCRYIGLVDRKTVDGKMARLVTESLRKMDADDPLKYDFALCHLGISKSCIHERSEEHCPGCPIESICTLE